MRSPVECSQTFTTGCQGRSDGTEKERAPIDRARVIGHGIHRPPERRGLTAPGLGRSRLAAVFRQARVIASPSVSSSALSSRTRVHP